MKKTGTAVLSLFLTLLMLFSLASSVFAEGETMPETAEETSAGEASETDTPAENVPTTGRDNVFSPVYHDGKTYLDFTGIDCGNVESKAAYVMCLDTGDVIYEKNPQILMFPASTVKLMTAIVVCEKIPDLDTFIYASENAVKISTGTRINLVNPIRADEGFTVRELLYAMLVAGANDAANVLAEYVGGTIEHFCELMNEKAAAIGAVNTTFRNPTGLHEDGMVTTAYDMALIARYAYYINEITKLAGSTNYTVEKTNKTDVRRYLNNRNRMILRVEGEKDYFYKGTLGLSAGYTPEGGNCVIAVAKREGLTYLAVILNGPDIDGENFAYVDARSLLDLCFDRFSMNTVAGSGTMICEIPVSLSSSIDHVTLYAKDDITALLPDTLDAETDLEYRRQILTDAKAPIRKGDSFGDLIVIYKGVTTLGRTELVAGSSVERSNFLFILDGIRRFLSSRFFRALIVFAVLLFILYCILYYKAFMRRRRYRR